MWRTLVFISCIFGWSITIAQSLPEPSFERSLLDLQQKIDSLKQHGEKLSDQSQREITELMTQLNHQHTLLKRELEEKDQALHDKLESAQAKQADWTHRINEAWGEIRTGAEKAWDKLHKGE